MRKTLNTVSIPTLAATLVLATGCGSHPTAETRSSEDARPAKIVTVGVPGTTPRTYPGRVQASQRATLAFRVGGPVIEILISKGQRVAAGQILARIDPRDYRVQVSNLEAQLAAVRAQQVQATEGYQRVRGLFEHDNASKADFDNAKAALEVSLAQVDATEQALKAARLSLADTDLRAPTAGTVADRLVEAHQTVKAGEAIVLFQGAGGMEVLIHVPEREVVDLTGREPAAILVRFDALSGSEPLLAKVKEFATETDRQTQTFPVTLELAGQPSADLLPGMTASVEWTLGNDGDNTGAKVVPLASVTSDPSGQAYVWRVDPDTMTISKTIVGTGSLTDSGLEIVSGLESGDQVLAAGVGFASEGQKVRPLDNIED